jgi:hypothetical protein
VFHDASCLGALVDRFARALSTTHCGDRYLRVAAFFGFDAPEKHYGCSVNV